MADILLSAVPYTGHVTPLCAVAQALVTRGHDVRVYTGGAFRERVERAGATLVPWTLAPDFDETDPGATFPRMVARKGIRQVIVNVLDCFIATAAAQLADLETEWARRPWRVVAADEVSLGANLFAERHALPWTTIAVAPLQLPSPTGPPSGLAVPPGVSWLGRRRDALLRGVVPVLAFPLTRAYGRQRAAAGLGARAAAFESAGFSAQSIVATGSPVLDFERPRPASVHFVGGLTAPSRGDGALPSWWGDLEGRRIVHVTQGTFNTDPDDLIRPALEALADEDVVVVVTTGTPGKDRLPFAVPGNARVAGFIPHAVLLPRVDVVITNGGWGGTIAALSHGIPLVVAGGDLDKPDVAVRVAWAGAGVNLRTGTPTAAQVAAGYRRVSADPSFRLTAGRIGTDLRARGGAEAAAAVIEARL